MAIELDELGDGTVREHTFSQSLCTSTSASCLQLIKLSIQPSKVGIVAGSRLTGASSAGAGRPTSSMLVSMTAKTGHARL
jgi:hypothetical protein